MEIRRAQHTDIPGIISFTTDTFEWGDYIPDVIEEWIDDPEGIAMVAIDDGRPVGLARTVLLTSSEAWAHGVRVHPDHRGKEIAGALAEALMEWARTQGVQVVRLLIEDDNVASARHVEKVGFRRTVRIVRAVRSVGEATANPKGNGVGHGPSTLKAKPARSPDVPLVMASWGSSEPGRALRGLFGMGWRFRTLRAPDVRSAAERSNLWEIGSSWAITSSIEPSFQIAMLDTRPDEAYDAIRALIDTANNRGAESMSMWLAPLDWLIQAARRAGCDIDPSSIWEYPL
ncbi:MAG: GNAT family N-acetyltransferase [Proteobacteria bacterium]|nr:GNAT family N-acetyltransferase [Pseudomonadota bacterium]